MKKLSDCFKNYFNVGAALSGSFLLSEPERKKAFDNMLKRFEEWKKNFKPEPGKPEFKFPDPPKYPKGPLPDLNLAKEHFNVIVADNDTKMENIYPAEDTFNFDMADRFVKFTKENNMKLRWHTLVWHNQSPKWIFQDKDGNKASKEMLEERLKKYIYTVGKRYAGDVYSVDVVNECISDKKYKLRDINDQSKWFDILGPDYVDKAFFWAKEAFPNSNLVINDYNLETNPKKRKGMYKLVKGMLKRKVPVDTVGLQMHINLENPPVKQIKKTIELFSKLGLKVIVTEMDVSVYKDFQPGNVHEAKKEYTKELLETQAERYRELFECFKEEAEKGYLKDVVLWGITDRFSWKNNFPVPGRTDIPLLFDTEGNPKPAFFAITE